ncbi:MAG: orotidine-5'-phosphate decarboxylase [Candidatus Omnitrophica bacterium]|nr:orotidine-5'-phosphate decarboxylase [Candidatus Omnitrophota bacterium]
MLKIEDKLIVALDVDTLDKAEYLVDLLYPEIRLFKVGSQLFTACGPSIVDFIREKGAEVFLDLKFFDIPNTVANAVRQAARLKVRMLTLHILGGEDMLKAAVKAAKEESGRLKIKPPLLIGVTVLTSQATKPAQVVALARAGISAGLDGVVSSVKEAALLRKSIHKGFIIVSPGIRPPGASLGDQKRVATAQEAINAGSDFLVVGRPILEAKDPLRAVKEIIGSL